MAVVVKNAQKVLEEERLIKEAVKRSKKQPNTTDETDWRAAMKVFHDAALNIRAYLNATYPEFCEAHPAMKTFRAAFGDGVDPETKEVALAMTLAKQQNDMPLIMMLLELQQYDTAMEYEARQLGDDYSEPRSWYEAWSDELGPWNGKGGTTEPTEDTPAEPEEE